MQKHQNPQAIIRNHVFIFQSCGDLKGAMALLKEKERICRELDEKNGLVISLANQALLLAQNIDRPHKVLLLLEEVYKRAIDHGIIALIQQIK